MRKHQRPLPPYTNAVDTAAQMQHYITEAEAAITGHARDRDTAIYAAHAAGRSIREIARRVGISHTQVKNIVDRSVAAGLTPHPDNGPIWLKEHGVEWAQVYGAETATVTGMVLGDAADLYQRKH